MLNILRWCKLVPLVEFFVAEPKPYTGLTSPARVECSVSEKQAV